MAQINKPTDYFNTKLYTGTGASNSVDVGFQTDFTWIKDRDSSEAYHYLYDTARGAGKAMYSNATSAEATNLNNLASFDASGFTLGTGGGVNASGDNFVSWNWLAGGTGVSNSDGSITSTVSANTTSGFSIVSWTGNSGTVGHGLGVKPACIIIKSRQTSNNWVVIHNKLTGGMSSNVLVLNSGDGETSGGAGMAEPTASVFTITSGLASNDNQIAYVFAEKKGFSKFGKYFGNGSTDGAFTYTGFKPAWLYVKRNASATNWKLLDNKRDPYNDGTGANLNTNDSSAEDDNSVYAVDFLSNGFKMRNVNANFNASGGGYIYMAFAEQPLVGTNNIPATAR